jgi:predicted XRE-type DNA-binding protein
MRKTDITPSSGNVFADLGLDAPDDLQAKAALMSRIAVILVEKKLTQTSAAKLLGIDQPRVSGLMNGKLSMFSTEKLLDLLTSLGHDVDIVVKKHKRRRGRGHIHVIDARP